MSRHEVIDERGKWVYGWDQMLVSFYLQFHDCTKPEDEQITTWLGADPSTHMYEVDDLVREAQKLGLHIGVRMQSKLYEERDLGI